MKRDGVMGVYSARWMEGMNTDGAQVEARESRLETMPLDRSAPQVGTTRRAPAPHAKRALPVRGSPRFRSCTED